MAILADMKTSFLRMFCEGKAAPTDRLEDGSTLLHMLFFAFLWGGMDDWYPECVDPYESLIGFLIDTGVPLNEQDVDGRTVLDNFAYSHVELNIYSRPKSKSEMSILKKVLRSGGLMSSFVSTRDISDWACYSMVQIGRYLLPDGPEDMIVAWNRTFSWNPTSTSKNHETLLSVLVDEWQGGYEEAFNTEDRVKLAHQMIRYLTFEALDLTHTCHGTTCGGRKVTRMDPEEVDEIREEEVSLIEELEALVSEFITTYNELGVGIYKFIFDHWWPRIDEVVPPEGEDPEERRRIRAAGYNPLD
ncbi:hypothetical protein BJX65DRAFT_314702 [Aspergillus insuetus]